MPRRLRAGSDPAAAPFSTGLSPPAAAGATVPHRRGGPRRSCHHRPPSPRQAPSLPRRFALYLISSPSARNLFGKPFGFFQISARTPVRGSSGKSGKDMDQGIWHTFGKLERV